MASLMLLRAPFDDTRERGKSCRLVAEGGARPRRVAQEVEDGGRRGRAPGRQRDGIVESRPAFFDALQDERCAQCAREVSNVERGVGCDRYAGFEVLLAEACFPGDAVVLHDCRREPGNARLLAERVEVELESGCDEIGLRPDPSGNRQWESENQGNQYASHDDGLLRRARLTQLIRRRCFLHSAGFSALCGSSVTRLNEKKGCRTRVPTAPPDHERMPVSTSRPCRRRPPARRTPSSPRGCRR